MNESSSDSLQYSCFDGGLSQNSVMPEYWDIPSEKKSAATTNAVVILLFTLVGLPSNLLVIIAILWQKLTREPTLILLLSLTLTDFLVCMLIMPFTVLSGFIGSFVFGSSDSIRCKMCQAGLVFVTLTIFSLHILSLISLDRFIYIKFPLKYHKVVTVKRTIVSIVVLWALCVILSAFPLFGFGDVMFAYSVSTCIVKFEHETRVTKNIYYLIFLVVEVVVLPLLVLFVTNIWVVCIVQRQIRKIYSTKKTMSSQDDFVLSISRKLKREKNHKQLQLIKVFGGILLANVLTWLPIIGSIFAAIVVKFSSWTAVVLSISVFSHAIVHPLIQAYLVPEIKNYLKYCAARVIKLLPCRSYQTRTVRDNNASDPVGDSFVSSDPLTGAVTSTEEVNMESSAKCVCFDVLSVTLLPDTVDKPHCDM